MNPNAVLETANAIFHGPCPKCSQHRGPVDFCRSYKVWSILILTRWTSQGQLSCRSCAVKPQLEGILFSSLAGWWGFPFGLIMTPVQITRNLIELLAPARKKPSPAELIS